MAYYRNTRSPPLRGVPGHGPPPKAFQSGRGGHDRQTWTQRPDDPASLATHLSALLSRQGTGTVSRAPSRVGVHSLWSPLPTTSWSASKEVCDRPRSRPSSRHRGGIYLQESGHAGHDGYPRRVRHCPAQQTDYATSGTGLARTSRPMGRILYG